MEPREHHEGASNQRSQADGHEHLPAAILEIADAFATEDNLPKVLELLQTTVAHMTEAVIVANAGGELVLQNPAAARLYDGGDCSAEMGNGDHWQVFDLDGNPIPPDQWPLARTLQGERFTGYELRVRHREKDRRFTGSYRGIPIVDGEGQLQYALVTIRDVTGEKEAEAELLRFNRMLEERIEQRTEALARSGEALLEARNRFFTLFHSSPVPTVLLALPDIEIVDANLAFRRYFGLEGQEVEGQAGREVVGQAVADSEERAHLLGAITEVGQVYNREVHLQHGDGEQSVGLISWEAAMLDGRPVAVCTVIDVTERVRAEEQVQQLAAQLSLAEERERRRIAQILHDDLQQMLVALRMRVQMGMRGDADAMHEALDYASEYTNEIIEKTRNLSVELSSPRHHSQHLRDSFAWVREFMAERYGLDVELEIGEGVELASLDLRGVIVRLVRELLFNTVKHAGVDEAILRAYVDGGRLWIQVGDQGRGFDPAALDRDPSGTGFGLRRMGEQVRLFGGEFRLDSAPGEGMRATIILPPRLLKQ